MRALAIVALLLSLMLAGLLLALRSEKLVLAAAHWCVENFTDLRLELREPQVEILRGRLTASEIHLLPKDPGMPPFLSLLDFSATTRVGDLFSAQLLHTAIHAGALLIYVSEFDTTEDPAPAEWLQYRGWLPQELDIDRVDIIAQTDKTRIFPLRQVHGARMEKRYYRLTANADFAGESLDVLLDLFAVREEARWTGLALHGRFLAPAGGSEVGVQGELLGTQDSFSYDLSLDASYRDINDLLAGFGGPDRLRGALKIKATMRGDADRFALSDASFELDNGPAYQFRATGTMEYAFSGDNSIRLDAEGELASLDYLVGWVGPQVAQLGRARARTTVSGSLARPRLDEFVLTTRSAEDLDVRFTGHWEPPEPGTDAPLPVNEVRIDAEGPSLSALERWLGPDLPDPGPWQASARLRGNRERIAVDQILVEAGNPDTVGIRATGAVANIAGTSELGLAGAEGVDLVFSTRVKDSTRLGELLGTPLPPRHTAELRMQLRGNGEALRASGGEISIHSADLQARLSQVEALIRPGDESWLQQTSAQLVAELNDTSALSQYTSRDVLSLGPLRISGRVAQHGAVFQLLDMEGGVSGEHLTLRAKGRIGDLGEFAGVQLRVEFSPLDTRNLLTVLLEDFHYASPLGQLQGTFRLGNGSGRWRLDDLDVVSTEEGGPLELAIRGSVDNLTDIDTADLRGSYHVRDPGLLETLSGLRMNPAAGSFDIESKPLQISFSARARVGDTEFTTDALINHRDKRIEGLRLVLSTPHIRLRDIGLQARQSPDDEYRPVERIRQRDRRNRFTQLLEHPPPFPMDIRINAARITGERTNIQRLKLHFTGAKMRYTLRGLNLTYADSDAVMAGAIDLNTDPPSFSLAGEAQGIPLNVLGHDLGFKMDVEGTVSLRGGLTATGRRPGDIVRTLDGSLTVALEDAVIAGAAYDMLATDFLAWIYSGALLEKSTHVDCTMAQFLLADGVARVDNLYIETAKMVATGKGEFDLRNKRMDVTITPLSKSRTMQVPSSVGLKGDFDDPKPTISPITAAADASAQVITLVPQLVMKLFGLDKQRQKRRRPCEAE
jgi:hypothetical protein